MSALSVVLGARGGSGGAVVRELVGRGERVRAVIRGGGTPFPDGVEPFVADLTVAEQAVRACDGAAVVYHCAQPAYGRWARDFPALNDAVVSGASAAGARLVFADNLYMYGPIEGAITERTPEHPSSRKGVVRKALAESLLARHEAGDLPVTIGRASDYFGPNGSGSVAGMIVPGALAGTAVRWPASADRPHTFSYLPDVARALVALGSNEASDGRAWILPAAPAVTARAFVGLVEEAIGRPVKLSVTSKLAMRAAGLFVPEAKELPDIWYQFEAPFTVDASAFEAAFGPFGVTPLADALAETVAAYGAASAR